MPPDPPSGPPPDARPSRRGFFRALLQRSVQPLIEHVDERIEAVRQATAPLRSAPPGPPPPAPRPRRTLLRPPGAIGEERFADVCQRCGQCVAACPVHAIVPLKTSAERLAGTPHIRPEQQACAVCSELACMAACPSGALVRTALFEIRMGLAVVHERLCVRTAGQDCRICVDVCPLGEKAITLEDGRVTVREPGCIGCGMCQERCPTDPRAIQVVPM